MKRKKTDFLIGTGIEKGDGQLDSSKSPTLPRYDKEQIPTVTTISRDRAPAFQEGSTIGAPQAEQIADRWHVIKNLTSAFEEVLRRQASAIKTHWQTIYAGELLPTAPAPAPEIKRIVSAVA
jgi:hypothetical protein